MQLNSSFFSTLTQRAVVTAVMLKLYHWVTAFPGRSFSYSRFILPQHHQALVYQDKWVMSPTFIKLKSWGRGHTSHFIVIFVMVLYCSHNVCMVHSNLKIQRMPFPRVTVTCKSRDCLSQGFHRELDEHYTFIWRLSRSLAVKIRAF